MYKHRPGNLGESAVKDYLIALPSFPNAKGFNHRTILVNAKDKNDAVNIARYLRPFANIGDIKEVNYTIVHPTPLTKE